MFYMPVLLFFRRFRVFAALPHINGNSDNILRSVAHHSGGPGYLRIGYRDNGLSADSALHSGSVQLAALPPNRSGNGTLLPADGFVLPAITGQCSLRDEIDA